MKVLQINATYGIGSTGRIVQAIDDCLRVNGDESFVAFRQSLIRPMKNGYRVGCWFSWKSHALLGRVRGKQAYFSVIATRRLIRYIDRLNPDIVHLHNLHSNYLHLNLLLSYLAVSGRKTIITMHDCWYYTGGCFHYSSAGCEEWKDGCHDCKKHDTYSLAGDASTRIWKDRMRYLMAIENLTIVGCSKWIIGEVRQSFLKEKDCRVIYNGFDLSVFKHTDSNLRKKLGLENRTVILGPAAKWLSEVNRDTFDFFVNHIGSDTVLLLFGSSTARADLPENVKLFGYTRDSVELAELYSMADVFVNCSREDTLSSINIECQACGTPVVTYDATGSEETVDGDVSRAVKTGDFVSLLAAAESVLSNTIDGQRCREWVYSRFYDKDNYQKYIDLYKEISSKE